MKKADPELIMKDGERENFPRCFGNIHAACCSSKKSVHSASNLPEWISFRIVLRGTNMASIWISARDKDRLEMEIAEAKTTETIRDIFKIAIGCLVVSIVISGCLTLFSLIIEAIWKFNWSQGNIFLWFSLIILILSIFICFLTHKMKIGLRSKPAPTSP